MHTSLRLVRPLITTLTLFTLALFTLALFTLVLCTLADAPLLAQGTGRLAGQVVDADGAPLPGVTITVASPAQIGGPRIAVTDQDGRFGFPSLRVGTYTLSAEIAGFVTYENPAIEVALGESRELEISLASARFEEQVIVVAETPVVDPEEVSLSQTYDLEFLENGVVGAGERGYQSTLNEAAGVTGGANPRVLGSTLGENAYIIDGIDTTDVITSTFGSNMIYDSIQEISFQTAGYQAEYGRATGGVVNVITKSGGNAFHGTLDYRYDDTDFQTEGEHFDPDDQETSFSDLSGTLGGYVLRDQLWFFAGLENGVTEITPTGAPTTRTFDGLNSIGKLTWLVDPSWNVVFSYTNDEADIDNANTGQFVLPEATRFQHQGGPTYSAQLFAVPTRTLAWNLYAAAIRDQLNSFPQSGDLTTAGHVDIATGISSVNFTNAQFSERNRDEYGTSLTWFVDDLAGDHEIKGGVELSEMNFVTESFTPGDLAYTDNDGPFILAFQPSPGEAELDGSLHSLYLQDTWRLQPWLTLDVGVRWDQADYQDNAGTEVADLDKVQPRVGIAWDITRDAKTILKANWGRFMDPGSVRLSQLARTDSLPTVRYVSCRVFSGTFLGVSPALCNDFFGGGTTQIGSLTVPLWRPDPQNFDPFGYFLFDFFGGGSTQIADDLEATYADTFLIGIEREIGRRTALGLTYVDKSTEQIFEDTCGGNFPVVGGSPACDFFIVANLDAARREYTGWILTFESRATDWLNLRGSYTYADAKASINYTQFAGADFDIVPVHFQNRFGRTQPRHQVKLNGYVALPLDFELGVEADYTSEFFYTAQEDAEELDPSFYGQAFLEPRGSSEANDTYVLNLGLRKGFNIRDTRLELIGTVFNVLDDEQPNNICQDVTGCGSFALGDAIGWQNPQSYQVGVRFEF